MDWAIWFGVAVVAVVTVGTYVLDRRPVRDEFGRHVDAYGRVVPSRERYVRTISRALLSVDNVPLSGYLIRSQVGMDRETFYDVTTYMSTVGLLETLVLDRDVAYRAFRLTGRGVVAARRRVTRGRTPR